jgi:hypothetical protein
MPGNVPKVDELGTTSAPLKSAAFFIGAYCKEYNGAWSYLNFMEGNADLFSSCASKRGPQRTSCSARTRTETLVIA